MIQIRMLLAQIHLPILVTMAPTQERELYSSIPSPAKFLAWSRKRLVRHVETTNHRRNTGGQARMESGVLRYTERTMEIPSGCGMAVGLRTAWRLITPTLHAALTPRTGSST